MLRTLAFATCTLLCGCRSENRNATISSRVPSPHADEEEEAGAPAIPSVLPPIAHHRRH